MSIEFILGIIVFALLPLIERLIRTARERQDGGARPAPPPWAPAPDDDDDEAYEIEPPRAPIPPMPAPRMERRPDAPVRPTPARPAQVRPQLKPAPVKSAPPSRAPSRVTAHDRRTDDAFKAGRPRRARRDIAAMLHSESGLRRAVVLMTILGPCRAFSPYDSPQH